MSSLTHLLVRLRVDLPTKATKGETFTALVANARASPDVREFHSLIQKRLTFESWKCGKVFILYTELLVLLYYIGRSSLSQSACHNAKDSLRSSNEGSAVALYSVGLLSLACSLSISISLPQLCHSEVCCQPTATVDADTATLVQPTCHTLQSSRPA